MPNPPAANMVRLNNFPTILVAVDPGAQFSLVQELRHQDYLILEAHNGPEALQIARVHSRAIHLLLTADNVDGRTLAANLTLYRPAMLVLYLSYASDAAELRLLTSKVRNLLPPPATQAPVEERAPLRRAKANGNAA